MKNTIKDLSNEIHEENINKFIHFYLIFLKVSYHKNKPHKLVVLLQKSPNKEKLSNGKLEVNHLQGIYGLLQQTQKKS